MADFKVRTKYPRRANWIKVYNNNGTIVLRHFFLGESIKLTPRQAEYFLKLDGKTDPLNVPGFIDIECRFLYDFFDSGMFLRKGRLIRSGISFLWTLFIPSQKGYNRFVYSLCNALLLLLFLPTLIYGIYRFNTVEPYMYIDNFWLTSILGTIISLVLHELAHAFACRAYGGRWLEMGFMWNIIPGAYVMTDISMIKNKLKVAQFYLAGPEMNLFLVGVMLIICSMEPVYVYYPEVSGTLFFIAIINGLLALSNLTFFSYFDGSRAIACLIGNDEFKEDSMQILKQLIYPGSDKKIFGTFIGKIGIVCSVIVLMYKVAFVFLIISELVLIFMEVFA